MGWRVKVRWRRMRMDEARVHGPDYLHIALRSGDLRISALLWVRSLHRPSLSVSTIPPPFNPSVQPRWRRVDSQDAG